MRFLDESSCRVQGLGSKGVYIAFSSGLRVGFRWLSCDTLGEGF